ncbi:MFS transporter [Calidifontibacter sp. DB0510]|uniref:MFS transporter n=1 Tax=Metallococcus carri TaxID=1656884 RepID=A0A967B4F0_9MICO|nr:MFS transporter [Metallococcus carri]NHN57343.1 MFS transporter [Metallococcus carri]NOP39121.1 MFS transporter [Calidifontibacter sp. DB2511S]
MTIASALRRVRVDTTPLRTSRDFRLLFWSGTVFYLGGMVTYVAVPYQLWSLTGSNFAVGALGLVELVPLVVFGLYGGALADHADRRWVLVGTGLAQAGLTALLVLNAVLPQPRVWAIYLVGALLVITQSLQRPSREALIPRTVRHNEMLAAVALSSLGMQIGMLAGPALGGVLVSRAGPAWCYAIDAVGLLLASALAVRLASYPHGEDAQAPSLRGIVEGMRYAIRRRDLLGTYVVDLVAMLTAMPVVLYPALAITILHRPELLGLLYIAETIGSMIAGLTSGWASHVHRHGAMVIVAAVAWGGFIGLAGLTSQVWLLLVCLMCAGACDQISAIFRGTIWHQTIPDSMRGRLAGIEMLSYSLGPLGGQTRAGLVADRFGVRRAIWSGGLLCVVGVAATAAALRGFWSYDARTDEHATRERAARAAAG